MFTGAPFQICFVIIGHKRVYLTLFILYRYYKDLLFVLVSKLYLHGSPVGDFNAKCASWYSKDNSANEGLKLRLLTPTTEGSKLKLLTSQSGLNQITNEPTHITKNYSTCIDLLFTSETNLVTESGVHSLLYSNCHHQTAFAKFDLIIFLFSSLRKKCMVL